MICLTTMIGYLGKYSINLLLDYFLIIIYGDNYDKRLFLYYIAALYGISLCFSILLYIIFKGCIFEDDTKKEKKEKKEKKNKKELKEKKNEEAIEEKKEMEEEKEKEKKKIIKITQICGYIIYSEKRKIKPPKKKNCCQLCCENFQNCWDEAACYLLEGSDDFFCCICEHCCCCGCCFFDCCDCCDSSHCCDCCCCECCEYYDCCDCYYDCNTWFSKPSCYCSICKNCKYDPIDYEKDEESFCYCYKVERKCQWFNKFMVNQTQKKVFPYMLEYFFLQLTTIGLENQYEKYKDLNIHRKTWIIIFISTFIYFFYLTITFNRYYNDEFERKKDKEENEKKNIKKETIGKLSNEILNGTHSIVLFNSLFSFIFSIFYFSNMSEEVKSFLFKDNINIIFIPILMNKFYYFTLNYYCIYTAEEDKKFEMISYSSIISFYIIIWNLIMTIIKSIIPDGNDNNDYNNYQILYIIQIIFASPVTLFVGICLFFGLLGGLGLLEYLDGCDNCSLILYYFSLHKYIFFLISFIFCFGGLWFRMLDCDGKYECYCDCCDVGDNCCNAYCIDNEILCDCCCCDKKSRCFSICCYKHCYSCRACDC